MTTNVTPNSFTGKLKSLRYRASTLPISGSGDALRKVIIELIDSILLEAKDEYKEEFTHSAPLPGSSPTNPLDMSPNVRHMTGVTQHVQPTQAPVVMIPAGQEPMNEAPHQVVRPTDAAPQVQLVPPGALSPGAPLPPNGNLQGQSIAQGQGSVELLDHALPTLLPGGGVAPTPVTR